MNSKPGTWTFAGALAIFLFAGSSAGQPRPTFAEQGWQRSERVRWYSATQGSRLLPLSWYEALEVADGTALFSSPETIEQFGYLTYTDEGGSSMPVGFAIDRQRSDRGFKKTQLRWYERERLLDGRRKESWMGLTCAACHTTDLVVGETRLRVDGAPAGADFQAFSEAFDAALRQTRDNPDKFGRFAARVLTGRDRPANRAMLRTALDSLIEWRTKIAQINATPLRYGPGRVDAIGHILNQVALFASPDDPKGNPSNAPVSYPFLWDTPHHDQVQWNGSASNKRTGLPNRYVDFSALGRNMGEVTGVFGEVVTRPPPLGRLSGYYSSAFVDNLEKMEKLVERLRAPKWPGGAFGAIQETKRTRGARLFQEKCSGCHAVMDRRPDTDPMIYAIMGFFADPPQGYRDRFEERRRRLPAGRTAFGSLPERNVPPGTDPAMACNAYDYQANSGNLTGLEYEVMDFATGRKEKRRIQPRERIGTLLSTLVKRSIFGQKGELAATFAAVATDLRRPLVVHNPGVSVGEPTDNESDREASGREEKAIAADLEDTESYLPVAGGSDMAPSGIAAPPSGGWGRYAACMAYPWAETLGYKARPLNGIWATAPYLHNGSVSSLYELLLPPARRRREFFTGTRRFDPKEVGFETEEAADNRFRLRAYDDNNEIIWGNWNGGHDYGNGTLSDEDRWALVEYMKSI